MGVEQQGLYIPQDVEAWHKWQSNAHATRQLKNAVKRFRNRGQVQPSPSDEVARGVLHTRDGASARLLSVVESTSPTSISSLIRPLEFLQTVPYAVLAPGDISELLPGDNWRVEELDTSELELKIQAEVVLSAGHYLPLGSAAYGYAQKTGARYVVLQHGLMTPFAPPLPLEAHLLAFSEADAHFWISGRTDVTYDVVGSQLFWDAALKPKADSAELGERVVFLGQMHGAELPRSSFIRATLKFVKEHRAVYRPHPQEKDKLSRVVHALMKKMGVTVDESQQPLNQINKPVVAIFSTGIIEAAIRGVPSWAYHPNPPGWLKEFWARYGMSQWGDSPTPPPALPQIEPAWSIATIITQQLEK